MNKHLFLLSLLISLLMISGCKSSSVQLPRGQASEHYYDCLYNQYNQAVSKGIEAGDKSIEAAIEKCEDAVMVFANAVARQNHHLPDKQGMHAYATYRPIYQKEAAKQLRQYLSSLEQ
jgi:hypothetical protein